VSQQPAATPARTPLLLLPSPSTTSSSVSPRERYTPRFTPPPLLLLPLPGAGGGLVGERVACEGEEGLVAFLAEARLTTLPQPLCCDRLEPISMVSATTTTKGALFRTTLLAHTLAQSSGEDSGLSHDILTWYA
jgi:hypothetical protein